MISFSDNVFCDNAGLSFVYLTCLFGIGMLFLHFSLYVNGKYAILYKVGSLTPKNPQSLTGSYFFVIFVYLIDRNAVLCYDTIYMEELP